MPDAEAVLAALLVLLDHAVRLERGDQPERGALVHAELAGDLGDAGLAEPGQDAQDGERPVDRLDRCRSLAACRSPWATVAHVVLRITECVSVDATI